MKISLFKITSFAALANMANAQTIVSAINVDLTQVGDLLSSTTTDLQQNVHEQDGHVAFDEGVTTLAAPLITNDPAGSIPAGTTVASFYFHFDPVGSDGRVVQNSGSITFDRNVLGIVYSNGFNGSLALLNASDATVGAPGVTYNNAIRRGTLENGFDGSLNFVGNTVTFSNLTVFARNQESFRVITDVVPEPSSTALFGLAGLALLARRKR